MSLCDRCYAPGQCCRVMHLSQNGEPLTVWTDEDVSAQARAHGLPFEPIAPLSSYVDPESGRPYATFEWTCPKLGADGRCTIYEDRPDVCRSFEAGSDPLCVHFNGAEAGTHD
ncbi:YkgJ family cysteine cluster protein [Bradyrhizobium septentrionale]|uniref:YkgJ family cysteine cluster protein n=1 Tax=Bradyrhizobium septentrionale TaxID=1404411 RepID=A0A973W382_9BRAD|nr:YkgJ family cysteine cluster protein [Bradyrhizobium septentrionale]UGY15168.1 YkgJ family cysteine cluster protein [Bradyrhizobium septentrionale]